MAKAKLTKRLVDRLKSTNPRGTRYYDTDLHGFGVSVYASGKRVFFIEWGDENHRRRMSLDPYGVVTVEEARDDAREKLRDARKGQDPLEAKRERREANTFSEWVARYVDEVKQRKKHPRADVYYLDLACKRFGPKRLTEVKTEDVERFFRSVAKTHKVAGNRALASVRACLAAAWRLGLIESNPALKVRPNPEPPPRARVLSDEELERLVAKLGQISNEFVRAAFVLLLETGARRSEVLRAKWADFDLDANPPTWRIPSPKAGRPQMQPLGASTVAMLRQLHHVGVLVVPGVSDPDKPRYDLAKPWKALRLAANLPGVRLHDLRRTLGSRVAQVVGLREASKVLRHSDIRVTERHYAPLGIGETRDAIETTHHLAKVLPMKRQTG